MGSNRYSNKAYGELISPQAQRDANMLVAAALPREEEYARGPTRSSSQKRVQTNLDEPQRVFTYLEKNRLVTGQRMHIGVVGNHVSDDAQFEDFLWSDAYKSLDNAQRVAVQQNLKLFRDHCKGFIVTLQGQNVELPWGDIVEIWPLEAADDVK